MSLICRYKHVSLGIVKYMNKANMLQLMWNNKTSTIMFTLELFTLETHLKKWELFLILDQQTLGFWIKILNCKVVQTKSFLMIMKLLIAVWKLNKQLSLPLGLVNLVAIFTMMILELENVMAKTPTAKSTSKDNNLEMLRNKKLFSPGQTSKAL